jgi:plastocyanin
VRWVNEGAVDHNTTGANGAWTSPNLAPNQTFQREFNTVGEFQYSCTLHPGMDGIIRVVQ